MNQVCGTRGPEFKLDITIKVLVRWLVVPATWLITGKGLSCIQFVMLGELDNGIGGSTSAGAGQRVKT